MNGNDISLIIAAVCAGAVTLGTLVMQVVTFLDTRKLKKMSAARDVQISLVKDLVNGRSEQLNAAIAKESYEAGRMHERLAPNEPTPPAIAVVLNPKPAPVDTQHTPAQPAAIDGSKPPG